MAQFVENKGGSSARSTKPSEYKEQGMPKTDKYSVDKNAKVNPRISTPSETKEEPEPGKTKV